MKKILDLFFIFPGSTIPSLITALSIGSWDLKTHWNKQLLSLLSSILLNHSDYEDAVYIVIIYHVLLSKSLLLLLLLLLLFIFTIFTVIS